MIGAGLTRTWAELDAATDAGVRAFRALGAAPGERVIIALPTGADLALALFTAARAGLIAVPISPSLDAGALADRVGALAAISDDPAHGLPMALDSARLAGWWSAAPESDPPTATGGGEGLALLARVRGDRAVMVSHRAILAAVDAIGGLGQLRLREGDRVLQVLPMYHLAGWAVSFLPTALVGGATVIPQIGFDSGITAGEPGAAPGTGGWELARSATESALAAAHDHRVTLVPGAPGFYHHLLGVPGAERSLSSVRLLTSGTAPLEPDDFARVRSLLGQPVWEGYGLSESASVVTSALTTSRPHSGSVGSPLPGIELRVIGPDGHDVSPVLGPQSADDAALGADRFDVVADAPDAGEVGRIAIRGSTLFSGYWPDGGGGPGSDGWFVTGDIGYLDDAGELHLVDRAGEVITVAGFTVYPREIEDILATHPYVAEVAVIGVPGTYGQDQIVAVLVARPGTHPTEDDLHEFVNRRLPPFKRPVAYHLVPSLPRTEVGRLDRGAVPRWHPVPDPWTGVTVPNGAVPNSAVPNGAASAGAAKPADAVDDATAGRPGGNPAAEPAPDVAPETVADLDILGTRLPASGDRVNRVEEDSDEDLF